MSVPKDNAVYLREWAADIRKHSGKSVDADRCDTIADEIERLREALGESVKLQSHYADLLNVHDGGQRMTFQDGAAWLERLAAITAAPNR